MHKKTIFNRKRALLFSSLLAVVLIFVVLEVTDKTHYFHQAKPLVTASQSTKGEPANSKNLPETTTSSIGSSEPGDQKSNSTESAATTLITPSGDFASNHHPYLSGSPAPNIITSVCITSPGSTCVINFTNGAITKSLPERTTDRGGAAYWDNWKLQDVGITAGTWNITATASLNGQIQSTSDALKLEVAQ